MNFLEYITRLALLTRVSEWHDKALSIVVCSLILLYTQPETPGQIGLFAAVTLFSMFLGCYGYSLNSYCELEQDAKAGKYHMFARGTGVACFRDTQSITKWIVTWCSLCVFLVGKTRSEIREFDEFFVPISARASLPSGRWNLGASFLF